MSKSRIPEFPCGNCDQLLHGIPPLMVTPGSKAEKVCIGSPEYESAKCPKCGNEYTIVKGTDKEPRDGCFWCPGCGAEIAEGTKTCPDCRMQFGR